MGARSRRKREWSRLTVGTFYRANARVLVVVKTPEMGSGESRQVGEEVYHHRRAQLAPCTGKRSSGTERGGRNVHRGKESRTKKYNRAGTIQYRGRAGEEEEEEEEEI